MRLAQQSNSAGLYNWPQVDTQYLCRVKKFHLVSGICTLENVIHLVSHDFVTSGSTDIL